MPKADVIAPSTEQVDTSFLEGLLGYNARRTSLAVIEVFMQRMAPYKLRPVDFSVLSLVAHNPGITSRQLCASLGVLPPNLVGMVNMLEKRELIRRAAPSARRPRCGPAPDGPGRKTGGPGRTNRDRAGERSCLPADGQ
jgi:hypothetical protein